MKRSERRSLARGPEQMKQLNSLEALSRSPACLLLQIESICPPPRITQTLQRHEHDRIGANRPNPARSVRLPLLFGDQFARFAAPSRLVGAYKQRVIGASLARSPFRVAPVFSMGVRDFTSRLAHAHKRARTLSHTQTQHPHFCLFV